MPTLAVEFETIVNNHPEMRWGIAVIDAENGELNAFASTMDEGQVAAASLNKLAVTYALHRSGLDGDLGRELVITETDKKAGAGILRYFPLGYRVPLGEVQRLALAISDNTACAMLVRHIGGPAKVNNVLSDHSGLRGTLLKPMNDEDSPTTPNEYGTTTILNAAELLRQALAVRSQQGALKHGNFYRGLRGSIEPHDWDEPQMQRKLAKFATRTRIQLPEFFYQRLLAGQVPPTRFPNKEGRLLADGDDPSLRHDVAQIDKKIAVVLSTNRMHFSEAAVDRHAYVIQSRVGHMVLKSQHKA